MDPADTPNHARPEPYGHHQRPTRSARRWGIALTALLLAALAGLIGYLLERSASTQDSTAGSPVTTVGVASAKLADVPVVLEALGTVTAKATVTVRPQVSGVLQKVYFKEGQKVRAGELLATIDPRPFELALMQATGLRQRDEALLASARLTLERYQKLLSQDSIARQEVDTQSALVQQLEAAVVSDRAAEGVARLNLGYSRILAPISGHIGFRTVDGGNVVNAGDANGIAVITQLSPVDVVFSVPQDSVGDVQAVAGQEIPATVLDRTRQVLLDTGVFSTLDNRIDTQTGTVRAKARFANSEGRLFPNQFVNVRLRLRTLQGVVVVPITALRRSNDSDFVYVLNRDQRTVSQQIVKRGMGTVDQVVISSGLREGAEVITEGADRLKDGARVALPGDKPSRPSGPR